MEFFAIALIVVGAGVGFLIYRANFQPKAIEADKPKRLSAGGEPTLEDVRPGGLFSLRAVGPDMEDFDVTVEARHVYDENGFQWAELEGDAGGRKVWVTVERDDDLEMSITLRKIGLDEIGLTKKKLKKMDDDEQGSFGFEGKDYKYEDSDEAEMWRDGDPDKREGFYYWEFESGDGKNFITVERWKDGSFECHVSQPLKPSQVTIYSVSGGA